MLAQPPSRPPTYSPPCCAVRTPYHSCGIGMPEVNSNSNSSSALSGLSLAYAGVTNTNLSSVMERVSRALWNLGIYGLGVNPDRRLPTYPLVSRAIPTAPVGAPEAITGKVGGVKAGDVWMCADGRLVVVYAVVGSDTSHDIKLFVNGDSYEMSRERFGLWLMSMGAIPVGAVMPMPPPSKV